MNWNHSVFYYNHAITDKFDELIDEVCKEINYLEENEDWSVNDAAKHKLLIKIRDLYEECQIEQMSDI